MKKVSLVFPPYLPSAASNPYLSIHLLGTILKNAGMYVFKHDFNLRLNEDLLNSDIYKEILDSLGDEPVRKNYELALKRIGTLRKGEHVDLWLWESMQYDLSLRLVKVPKTLGEYFSNGVELHPYITNRLSDYVDSILLDSPDSVGLSIAFGEQLIFGLELAKLIRQKNKDITILIGGAQISLLDKSQISLLVENCCVDIIFQGYAEDEIVGIVKKFGVQDKPLALKGGVTTKESLKNLPFVEFDEDINYNNSNRYPVLVTKGCYWGKCEFCDYVLMGDLGDERYIARPVEEVFAELKHIRAKNPDSEFMLISDAVPPHWYLRLARLANAEKFPLKTISYMINNKSLNEDFFKELSMAKVSHFTFGTESTSDRVLKLMKKQATQKVIIKNLTLARKYGIYVQINLIPNYPTTTFEEAIEAYKIMYLFRDIISSISVFKFYLSANTSMFRNPSAFGMEIPDAPYLKSDQNGYHTVNYTSSGGMTKDQEDIVYNKLIKLDIEIRKNTMRRIKDER